MSGDSTREHAGPEADLIESRHFAQSILDTSPNLIYIFDLVEHRNVYANHEVADFLGYTPEEIAAFGPTLFENILHPEDAERVATHHTHFVTAGDGGMVEVEYRMKHACGEWRWLRSRDVVFTRDENGRATQILGFSEDITERKQSEEALRESEARFRATFEQATIGMAQVDLDGGWIQVNDRLCEILGYSREELLALTFADITSPDTVEADVQVFRAFQKGEGKAYRVEKRYVRKDGSLVWVDLTSSAVRDANGRIAYFVDVIEDIDDRKRAEEALRESEERYRALVEAVRDVVFVIGRDDRIQYVNDAAAAWLRTGTQDLIGTTRSDVFPTDDEWSGHQAESLRRVFETGEPLYVEYPARFPAGVRWQATSLAPLRGADGSIEAVLGIGRDISDRKQAEERRVGELEHLAHADALTGLLNRRGFDLLTKQSVEQAARAGQGIGVIYADMDDLKALNDECGHAAGDQALRDAATVLRVTVRSADVIARIGGDEFVIFAVGDDEDSIEMLVDRVQEGIAVFNAAHDRPRPLAISCGVAWRPAGARFRLGRVIADADAAMYREKAHRRAPARSADAKRG